VTAIFEMIANGNTPRTNDNSCDLFCFKECSDKYENMIKKREGENFTEKLSLKKLAANNMGYEQK
jgi:hypothetical protein